MKIAILTRPDFRSPRILAESLKLQLESRGLEVEIFDNINLLNRLVSLKESKLSFHFWLKEKIANYFMDKKVLGKLKRFNIIIISECSPNAFLRRLYNVEKFKKIINKPVGFYEVYYLGNAPTQVNGLKNNKDALLERFDFHLSVAEVTEIRVPLINNYFPIGINSISWNLKPFPKKELIAIVDFAQPGYEKYRTIQIRALQEAGIKFISLEKSYTFTEIRKIYQKSAIFFVQFPEAFGISLLECLCCGCQIFIPESGWPMSWRLNENPAIHGDGVLPECFTVYDNESQLVKKLLAFKELYDMVETPKKVFEIFLSNYPEYYYGNQKELNRMFGSFQNKNMNEKQ